MFENFLINNQVNRKIHAIEFILFGLFIFWPVNNVVTRNIEQTHVKHECTCLPSAQQPAQTQLSGDLQRDEEEEEEETEELECEARNDSPNNTREEVRPTNQPKKASKTPGIAIAEITLPGKGCLAPPVVIPNRETGAIGPITKKEYDDYYGKRGFPQKCKHAALNAGLAVVNAFGNPGIHVACVASRAIKGLN